MPQRPSILVLGARGRIGLAVTRAFAQAGWRVHAQVRPGATGPAIAGVQWLQAQPADTQRIAAAARGAQVVFHGLSPVYTHKAWRADLSGLTQAAIDAAKALGATLIAPASVYNFGEGMPRLLGEDTPQTPTTFKGRLRVEAEEQIRAATEDGSLRAVLVRAGDFYGSGSGSWVDLIIAKDLQRGLLTYPGAYDVSTAWAYTPDLARAIVKVAEKRDQLPAFETLHFAGTSRTGADWAEAIEPIARGQGWLRNGAPLRSKSLSWLLVRIAGFVMPTMAAVHEMRYLWRTPYALDNRKLVALIGEEPHTPFAQAVRESLADIGLLNAKAALREQHAAA